MDTRISLIKSTFYDEETTKKALSEFILQSERLSMGEICEKYEKAFANAQKRECAVAFNSGSSANLALIQALLNLEYLKAGDKVGFSAVTWATNVMPIMQLGLTPIPIDIEVETLNVSTNTLNRAIERNPDLKALFLTNLLGFCGDIDSIRKVCDTNNVVLFEDNCESFGSVYKQIMLGNFGIASTFSTFVGHHLSTIEGGVVCTDDLEIDAMLRMVRAHGWDRSLDFNQRTKLRTAHEVGTFYDLYTFYFPGFNLRPTEITGFLGLQQLAHAEEIVRLRNRNFIAFDSAARKNSNLYRVSGTHLDFVSNFAYPVIARRTSDFDALIERFASNGVEVRPIVGGNIARQPFFVRSYGSEVILPNAEHIHHHGFYFPNNPELTGDEIDHLCCLLAE